MVREDLRENPPDDETSAGRDVAIKKAKVILKGIQVLDDAAVAQVAQDPELWGMIRRQMGVDPERVVNEIVAAARDELATEKAAGEEAFQKELHAARRRSTD